MRRFILGGLLILPLAVFADSGPLFMKHLLGEREFYEPWGVGIDFYTMDQPYKIKSLQFDLPGVVIPDASVVQVQNDVQHYDVKLDVWLTPFLNIFGILGHLNAKTTVDFSNVPGFALPFPPVRYDGTVYGGGFTLAFGSERWFASVTSTWTNTSLSGDFDSSAKSFTAQPRIGLIKDKWTFWVGALYIDAQEDHSGSIVIPGIATVPFAVELDNSSKWNTAFGVGHVFNPKAMLYLEVGVGKRDHTLFNFTYRF